MGLTLGKGRVTMAPSFKLTDDSVSRKELLRKMIEPGLLEKFTKLEPDNLGHIGARNPYALAEAIEKSFIPWDTMGAEGCQKRLEKVFALDPGDCHKLFDSKHGSPLHVGVLYKSRKDWYQAMDWDITSNLPGEFQACSDAVAGWDRYKPGGIPAKYSIKKSSSATETGTSTALEMEDTVQGCVPDCFFLAALCSVAWARSKKLKLVQLDASGSPITEAPPVPGVEPGPGNQNPQFIVNFFDKPGTPATTGPTYTYDDLPLTAKNELAYAKPNPNRSKEENWMAIYEKAYAKYCKLAIWDNNPDHPDIAKFTGGDPMQALVQLTGLLWDSTTRYTTTQAGIDIFSKITLQCKQKGSCWRTKYPMVAWTYLTAPAGATYASDMIVANHVYSILGAGMWKPTGSTTFKKYIVLRNPYGPCWCGDPILAAAGNLAEGSYDVDKIDEDPNSLAFKKELKKSVCDDGIFGLNVDVFKTHFMEYGWVR